MYIYMLVVNRKMKLNVFIYSNCIESLMLKRGDGWDPILNPVRINSTIFGRKIQNPCILNSESDF